MSSILQLTKRGNGLFLAICICMMSPIGLSQLNGIYTVGTSGTEDFNSFTNTSGVFETINSVGLSGNVTFQVTSNIPNESGANSLNQWVGGFSLYIVPDSASLKTITHANCVTEMITFNDADNVTIDGSLGTSNRYLRFESTCSDQSTIRLDGDCQNFTIRNCEIGSNNSLSSTTNGGALHISRNQLVGHDNLTIYNNLIEDQSGVADLFDALQVNAPDNGGVFLDNLIISQNEFKNFDGKGIYIIERQGSINNSLLQGNHFYGDISITGPGPLWAYAPIQIESGGGHIIRGNHIGGQSKNCGGSKLQLNLEPGTQLVQFIRMKDELFNVATNYIDSNVIRNIEVNGNPNNYIGVSGIRIEMSNSDIGTIYPNYIGDCNVDASLPATASIVVTENRNSTSNYFRGIYTSSTGSVTAANNYIGGVLMNESTSTGLSAYLLYSYGTSANFINNQIGGVPNNIVKRSNGNFRGIVSYLDDSPFSIIDNRISGFTAHTEFDNDFYGIRITSGNGVPTVSANEINNIQIIQTSNSNRFYGVVVNHTNPLIDSNYIHDNTIISDYSGTQFTGIYATLSGGFANVNDNIIENNSTQHPSGGYADALGIWLSGSSSYNCKRNFIGDFDIQIAHPSTFIRGIYLTATGSINVVNNVVLLSNSLSSVPLYIYGIYDNSAGGTNNIWYNTVDIDGVGSQRSACYYKNNGANRDVRNNIFQNRRTGGGMGQYALYINSTSGSLSFNYNLLNAWENQNLTARYSGSDRSFSQWQALGYGLNSVSIITNTDLVNSTNGHQTTNLGNDIADGSVGVLNDHDFSLRPQGGGYDMGAFELNNLPPHNLPVELESFGAFCEGEKVILEWATISEHDNDFFLVEKSTDGINWMEIQRVNGSGTTLIGQSYSLSIDRSGDLTNYFKLSQVDINGTKEHLGIESSSCTSSSSCNDFIVKESGEGILVYLNNSCFSGTSTCTLFDNSGRKVASNSTTDNMIIFSPLKQGLYHIVIENSNKLVSKKFHVF